MPPKDAQPSELWLQITAMPRPHRVVPFPRKGIVAEIAMVVLTGDESMAAKASTERHVRKLLREDPKVATKGESGQGYLDLCEQRDSQELLFRACKQPGDLSRSFFPTIESIGANLTTDEIAVLVLHYRRTMAELGPIVSEMSQEECDAWIEMLAKGGSLDPFDLLSLGQQSRLMRYMAVQCWASRTGNSSPGTPLDESGDDA